MSRRIRRSAAESVRPPPLAAHLDNVVSQSWRLPRRISESPPLWTRPRAYERSRRSSSATVDKLPWNTFSPTNDWHHSSYTTKISPSISATGSAGRAIEPLVRQSSASCASTRATQQGNSAQLNSHASLTFYSEWVTYLCAAQQSIRTVMTCDITGQFVEIDIGGNWDYWTDETIKRRSKAAKQLIYCTALLDDSFR